MAKFHFYNNGEKTIKIYPDMEISEGYVRGRLNQPPAWNKGLTKETDERVKDNCLKLHATRRKNNSYNAWNKGLTKETDDRVKDNHEKSRKTLLKKYGITNPSQLPHDAWNKGLTKDIDDRVKKISDSNKGKTAWNKGISIPGTPHTEETKKKLSDIHSTEEMKQRKIIAKRNNGTFNSSKPEELLYKLLVKRFGEADIIRQYFDKERYPFACDFYVKSKDLFIELNAHFTHYFEPYNENKKEHIEKVNKLKSKPQTRINAKGKEVPSWDNAILYTWTQLDVRKKNTAIKNKLNYKAIYLNLKLGKPHELLGNLVNEL